jgi:hypothetical protein
MKNIPPRDRELSRVAALAQLFPHVESPFCVFVPFLAPSARFMEAERSSKTGRPRFWRIDPFEFVPFEFILFEFMPFGLAALSLPCLAIIEEAMNYAADCRVRLYRRVEVYLNLDMRPVKIARVGLLVK